MKRCILAAVVATAPVLAATSANAITVPQGSNLSISLSGVYTTVGGGNIVPGSSLNFESASISFITSTGPGVDLDGLAIGSAVTISEPLNLADSSNSGKMLSFAGSSSTFTVDSTFDTLISAPGPGGVKLSSLGVFDGLDGSFEFATTSKLPSQTFQATLSVPPTVSSEINVVPLPAAAWMLLAGLGSLWAFRLRTHA